MDPRYDVIIVGGGSAGCVLAARLSEEGDCAVLLLEAGPDYTADELPGDLLDGLHGPCTQSHDWGLTGHSGARALELPRGRVIGGSSATNATFALRGSPHDYDSWRLPGWSFADVLPSFAALERDLDYGTEQSHGSRGPVPIRRYLGTERSPLAEAATEAFEAAGLPVIADHNAPYAVGVGPLPVNAVDGRRMSTASTHLEPARTRPNLTVRGGAMVEEVLMDRRRAVGVRLSGGMKYLGTEVIVAAGSYLSPRLLTRSGIRAPSIGANLIDHPAVSIDLPYVGPVEDHARYQLIGTLHSTMADAASQAPDLQVIAAGPFSSGRPSDPPVLFVGAALLRPRSRGSVDARIDLNYYDHPDDLPRLLEALEVVEDALAHPAMRSITGGGRLTPRFTDPGDLRHWAVTNTWSYHHPVGTCAMGSVVDTHCRVIDVEALSVVDASVMPDIPSANTNIPTIMIAERVAAHRRGSVEESRAVTAR